MDSAAGTSHRSSYTGAEAEICAAHDSDIGSWNWRDHRRLYADQRRVVEAADYPDPESLVTIHVRAEDHRERWGFSYPDFLDSKSDCRSFENLAAWTYGGGTISAPEAGR